MPTDVTDVNRALAEDAAGALADVLGGDAGQPLVRHRQREREHAVRPLLRSHAEVDQVVPVERRVQQRRRDFRREQRVRLALGIEVRDVVLAHQHRHALAVGGEERPRVLQRGPDHVLHARLRRGVGHRAGLREFLVGREVLPEVRHAEGAPGAVHRALHARRVVQVGGDDLRAGLRQRASGVGVGLAGHRPHGESARGVREQRARQAAALGAGGAEHRDDPVGHGMFLPGVGLLEPLR